MLELQNLEDVSGAGPHADGPGSDEMECKICYSAYDLESCRPKVLDCRHRLCSKCLSKILDLGESPPDALVCPFCRRTTRFLGEAARNLPDDRSLVARLVLQGRNQRNLRIQPDWEAELLLSPRRLDALMGSHPSRAAASISSSPDFLVITILEPPPAQDRRLGSCTLTRAWSSWDSLASASRRWTVWTCSALMCRTSARVLLWVLGLLYFSSLPMGVYLLIMQRTTVGALLVSLVPAGLVLILIYGFCQCVCDELWLCWPP